jgi:hypothetical protein
LLTTSLWKASHPDYRRVALGEWGKPRCDGWIRRLDEAVVAEVQDEIVVAHSSACALVGHWWARRQKVIWGALLVAPSDTESPSTATTFPMAIAQSRRTCNVLDRHNFRIARDSGAIPSLAARRFTLAGVRGGGLNAHRAEQTRNHMKGIRGSGSEYIEPQILFSASIPEQMVHPYMEAR